MEHSKRPLYDLITFEFYLNHHNSTLENVQVARAIVRANSEAIDNCVRNGTFSVKQLMEIERDGNLQTIYSLMTLYQEKGSKELFEPLYNMIKDTPDTFCGWLVYQSQYLEQTLDMDLMKRTRIEHHFRDFIEHNSVKST